MEVIKIDNANKCTFNIHIGGEKQPLRVESGPATVHNGRLVTDNNRNCPCETVAVNTETQHFSENYMECYRDSFPQSCSSGLELSHYPKNSSEGEAKFKSTSARNFFSDKQISSCDSGIDVKQEEEGTSNFVIDSCTDCNRKITTDAFCQTSFSTEDITNASCMNEDSDAPHIIAFEHLNDGEGIGKSLLEKEKLAHLDNEPNIQELNEIQDINPDPVLKCDNVAGTCKHLQFSTLNERTGGSSISDGSDPAETLNKEVESRQFQELLKDNEENESMLSFITAYPLQSTGWCSKYQRTMSSETGSYKENLEDEMTNMTTESVSFYKKHVSKSDPDISFQLKTVPPSSEKKNLIDLSSTDKQLNGSDSDQSDLLICSSTKCIDLSLIHFDDGDETNITSGEIVQKSKVSHVINEETNKLKLVDILLMEDWQNSEICKSNKQMHPLMLSKQPCRCSESVCTEIYSSETRSCVQSNCSGNFETVHSNSKPSTRTDSSERSRQTDGAQHNETEDSDVLQHFAETDLIDNNTFREKRVLRWNSVGNFANLDECPEEREHDMINEKAESATNDICSAVEVIGQISENRIFVDEQNSEDTSNGERFELASIKDEKIISAEVPGLKTYAEDISEPSKNDCSKDFRENNKNLRNTFHSSHHLLDDGNHNDFETGIDAWGKIKETITNSADSVFKNFENSQITGICSFTSEDGNEMKQVPQNESIIMPHHSDILEPDIDSASTTACGSFSDMELSDEEDYSNPDYLTGLENESGYVSYSSKMYVSKTSFEKDVSSFAGYENESCHASQTPLFLSKKDLEEVVKNYTTNEKYRNKTNDKTLKRADNAVNHISQNEKKKFYSVDQGKGEDINENMELYTALTHQVAISDVTSHINCKPCISLDKFDQCCENRNTSGCSLCTLSIDNASLQGESNDTCLTTGNEKGFLKACDESMPYYESCSEIEKVVFSPRRKRALKRRKKWQTNVERSRLSYLKKDKHNLPCTRYSMNTSTSSSISSFPSRLQKVQKGKSKTKSALVRGCRKSSCSTLSLCSSSSESSDTASALPFCNRSKARSMLKKEAMKSKSPVTVQRCNNCYILLSISNPRCKRHWQPRLPFQEGDSSLGDIDRGNRGNRNNSLKQELSQSNIDDSGIGSSKRNSKASVEMFTNSLKKNGNSVNSLMSLNKTITSDQHRRSVSSLLSMNNTITSDQHGRSVNFDLSASEKLVISDRYSLHLGEEMSFFEIHEHAGQSFKPDDFTSDLSCFNTDNETECHGDCEKSSVYWSDNTSQVTTLKGQKTQFHWKKSSKYRKGTRLIVFNRKEHIKYQQKTLKDYFSNKRNLLKSFVKEIHVEHRHLPIFGLGSYFDRFNNGPPPTTQERMQYEWLRLATFHNYTGNGNALALARNGFYHDHTEGPMTTRCYLCDARHSNWQMFDNVNAEHRRQSPNCPFHENSGQESVNISITSGDSEGEASAQTRTSAPMVTSVNTTVTASSTASSSAAAVSEAMRSLQMGQASSSGGESISQQPTEDPESGDRSLLALSQPRRQQVLGRSGQAYSTIIAPRRNNVATGARNGIDPLGSSSSTSSTTRQNPGIRPSSILGGPVGAGAFAGLDTGALATVSRTSEGLQQNALSSSTEAAAGARQTNPAPGAGGRTDPTITVLVDNPKHPDYINIDSRVNSYQGWPDYLDQTPRQMSEAGFFFVGVADFTRCFCCGGGLRNWEPGDDPMLEHTRWFPRCEYVNKLKGERYVAAVQRRHQEHMADQQRQQIEISQIRDENRNPPDPMTTEAAAVLREMGYSAERTKEAILAVRRQIGSALVTTQQVLSWLLDDEERRLTGNSSNTELGIRPAPSSTATSISNTSTPSSIVYTGTSISSSIVYTGTSIGTSIVDTTSSISTATSIVSAGTTTSTTSSSVSTTATAEVKQSGTPAGAGSSGTGNQKTGSGNSSSSNSASGSSVEKQSGASGGDSDGSKAAAKEGASSSETKTKTTKKKNAKKKAKNKATAKSETAGATGGDVDAKSLKAENEKLREMQTCKICMERAVNTTLLPCGHLVCCDTCAARLQRCPICRKRIKGTVKTFMS